MSENKPSVGETSKALVTRPARFAPARSAQARLRQRFPTVQYLREHARRRVPRFGFEAVDGGAGTDGGVARNAAAFDAIELMPRYGVDAGVCSTEVELFGRTYAAPFGIAPMGMTGIVWPDSEKFLAAAARRARIPYVAGTVSSASVEELADLAGDMLWFQLYRVSGNDHAAGLDLTRRAQAAGAHVLVMTLDTPTRTKRPRELREGLVLPFRKSLRNVWDVLVCPAWLAQYLKCGLPRFGNYRAYVESPTSHQLERFAQTNAGGAFTWAEVARYRDVWRGPLLVKGVLHPADAETALSVGVDGIVVSNHGGRQIEGLPASIDVLPSIVARVGNRTTVMVDSGVRSGLDIVRAVALGAKMAFAGRAFLYGLGAIGDAGPGYVIDLLKEEVIDTMRQLGVETMTDATKIELRHPGAWKL